MNPIAKLMPALNKRLSTGEDEHTPEEIAADEKRARIEFHRKEVRNGPVKYRKVTNGQRRRAAERDQKTLHRKINLKHRRGFMDKRFENAKLRGLLQAAGVIAYRNPDFAPSYAARAQAISMLTQIYGQRDEKGNLVILDGDADLAANALANALDDYLTRTGAKKVDA